MLLGYELSSLQFVAAVMRAVLAYLLLARTRTSRGSPALEISLLGSKVSCKSLVLFLPCHMACGIWDLSSLTRDRTRAPCSGSAES